MRVQRARFALLIILGSTALIPLTGSAQTTQDIQIIRSQGADRLQLYDLNDDGEACGEVLVNCAGNTCHHGPAVVYSSTTRAYVPLPDSVGGHCAIDDSGRVAYTSTDGSLAFGQAGSAQILGKAAPYNLAADEIWMNPTGINERGDIVGYFRANRHLLGITVVTERPFVYSDGVFRDLSAILSAEAQVTWTAMGSVRINASGTIVGWYWPGAYDYGWGGIFSFVIDWPDVVRFEGNLTDDYRTFVNAVNDAGHYVGYTSVDNFVVDGDGLHHLVGPGGRTDCFLYDINDHEEILGQCGSEAYVWIGSQPIAVRDMVAGTDADGLNPGSAWAINNRHQILGSGDLAGEGVYFLLTAAIPPSTPTFTTTPQTPNPTSTPTPESLRYNQVRQKSSHNAYERDEALGDQLIYHRIHSLELDVHRNERESGNWLVFHDNASDQSSCRTFSACLEELASFHRANPDHEVVTLFIELKDGFDARHNPKQFDALIDKYLDGRRYAGGRTTFRPGDFLASCPGSTDLRSARAECGWPLLSDLRGRFLIVVNGPPEAHVGENYIPNNDIAHGRMAFFMHDIRGEADDIFEPLPSAVLFMNFKKTGDWCHLANTASRNGLVTRAWEIEDEDGWDEAAHAHVHHIATNKVNAERDPWASTANARGWPFTPLDGTSSDLSEETRQISMLVDSDDIWDQADSFAFLPTHVDGNEKTTWTASISTASSHVDPFAKGCLMARANFSPESAYIALCRPADGHPLRMQWREDLANETMTAEMTTLLLATKIKPVILPIDLSPLPIDVNDLMHVELTIYPYNSGQNRTCAKGRVSRDGKKWWRIQSKNVCVSSRLPLQGLATSGHGNESPVTFVYSNLTRKIRRFVVPYATDSFEELAAVGTGAAMDAVDGFFPRGHRVPTKADAILWIHGVDGDPRGTTGNNLRSTFKDGIEEFRKEGWTGPNFVVSYYDHDSTTWGEEQDQEDEEEAARLGVTILDLDDGVSGCPHGEYYPDGHAEGRECSGPRAHRRDTDIRHLAYHLAWEIYNRFTHNEKRVRIIAHSMGGLITRYALLAVEREEPGFPSRLDVAAVNTFGTPYEGGDLLGFCTWFFGPDGCPAVLPLQLRQMTSGSDFLEDLGAFVPTGGSIGHTRWWLYGAQDDDQVRIESSLAPRGASTIEYDSGQHIQHEDYFHDDDEPYRCRINHSEWKASCKWPMHLAASETLQ